MRTLDEELLYLQNDVLALGRTVENAIAQSVVTLEPRDLHGSELLITLDHQITKKRLIIEMNCLTLIGSRPAVGGELAVLNAMIEIAIELEHIGYYLTDVARIHFMLVKVDDPWLEVLDDLQAMAIKAEGMLRRALGAWRDQDVDLAWAVHSEDSEVDARYYDLYLRLLQEMKGQSRAGIKQARYLSQIARNLERTADRVTNICEWVIFAFTGELVQDDRESIGLVPAQ